MSGDGAEGPRDRPHWHGRRRGHRLRSGRLGLMATLLPRLRPQIPEDGGAIDANGLFEPPPADLWLEIGFGAGRHLAAQAAAHPDIGIIGCEPFVNGVASLLSLIEGGGLANIRIFDDDARMLLALLPEASIGRVFLLFPDPWPKKRHHKRRFVSPGNLDSLARVMKDGAELRFASDHMEYVRWTLDQVTRHPCFAWPAKRPADWRRRPEDGFESRYEAKALGQDLACVHLSFRRCPRA